MAGFQRFFDLAYFLAFKRNRSAPVPFRTARLRSRPLASGRGWLCARIHVRTVSAAGEAKAFKNEDGPEGSLSSYSTTGKPSRRDRRQTTRVYCESSRTQALSTQEVAAIPVA